MDGDAAPLAGLCDLAERFQVGLVVDEAHATGVYGRNGGGLISKLGLGQRVLVKLGTLSKALGTIGGYASGSSELIEFLVNHCRSYLFSTAPPIPIMLAARQAVTLLSEMESDRVHLRRQSAWLRNTLAARGWRVPPGDSPIVPIIVGAENAALSLHARLQGSGMYAPAIRPPTVPVGTCRLRISLSSVPQTARTTTARRCTRIS